MVEGAGLFYSVGREVSKVLRRLLFETKAGEAVLEALERWAGLAIVETENCRAGLCAVEVRKLREEPACSRLGTAAQ